MTSHISEMTIIKFIIPALSSKPSLPDGHSDSQEPCRAELTLNERGFSSLAWAPNSKRRIAAVELSFFDIINVVFTWPIYQNLFGLARLASRVGFLLVERTSR